MAVREKNMKKKLLLGIGALAIGGVLTWVLPVRAYSAGSMDALAPSAIVQGYDPSDANQAAGSRLLSTSLYAGDALHANILGRVPGKAGMLVASLVQMGDLSKTSTFGRLVARQVASRLAEYGYAVRESGMRASMAVKQGEGEFLLSRDLDKLAQREIGAQYALTGFYERTESEVFVSVRVVRLANGAVMGGYEYSLPMTGAVRRLFESPQAGKDVWQRYTGRSRMAPTGNIPDLSRGARADAGNPETPFFVTPATPTGQGPVRVQGPHRVPGPLREDDIGQADAFPALAPPTRLLH